MASNTQCEFNAIKFIMEAQKPELLVSIMPEYFGNVELKKIFMLVRKFYVDNSTFMGWDLIRAAVSKACKTPEKMKFMLSILDQIQGRDIKGLTEELIVKELRDYRKFRLVLDKVAPLISAVEDKDIDTTLGKLKELHDAVFVDEAVGVDADMASMVYEDVEFKFKKTGIPSIDERGGLIVGGYTIIAAPKKTGKSALSCQIATYQFVELGDSVAYFTYEMGAAEIRARMMANIADLDLGEIMNKTLSPADIVKLWKAEAHFMWEGTEESEVTEGMTRRMYFEYIRDNYPRRKNKFLIIDNRPDWDALWAKSSLLATTEGVTTFVYDYPYLINRGAAHKELQTWEYALQQSRNLKAFAYKHQSCVITPAQLDAGAKKGDTPKLRFVTNAEQDCDLSLYMTKEDDDKTLGTTSVKWGVCRNFKSIPGRPYLEDFKLLNELNKGRFAPLEY